jgi:DNA-binding response OmpR family regulator
MTKEDLSILKECNSKSAVFLESAADYSKEIWLISDDSEAVRESIKFFDHNQSGFFLRSLKTKIQFADIFSDGFKSVKPCAIILDPSFENNYGYFILEQMRARAKEQGILFIFLAENFSDLSYFSLFGLSADIFVTKPADDILLSYILEKSKINYQR